MLGKMRFFRTIYLVATFAVILVLLPGMAGARKERQSPEVRRIDARITSEREIWRTPFQALSEKQRNKLNWDLVKLVAYPDQVKIGFLYAENFAVDLKNEVILFHVTVVTDGCRQGVEELGLELRPFVGDMFSTIATFPQILALTKLNNVVWVELCEKFKLLLDESVPQTSANLAQGLEFTTGEPNSGEDKICLHARDDVAK